MTEAATDIPRWANELGQEKWARIKELLYEGWQPAAVRRELDIPEKKKRSLEQFAGRYRHRRIMAPLTRLAEMLAGGALSMGPDYLRILGLVVSQGLSTDDESKRQKAAAILSKFMGKVMQIGAEHEAAEAERQQEERTTDERLDASAVMRQVLDRYGVQFDGGDNG